MTKIKLLEDLTIGLVDYSKGDVLDVAGVTADKLINRKKAEAANSDLVVETDDPLVNNYRADQPLEDNNDGD